MANADPDDTDNPKKKSKLPLILGLVVSLLGGAAGFFLAYTGMLFGSDPADEGMAKEEVASVKAMPDIAFVEMAPITVSLTDQGAVRHLLFRAQLETPSAYQKEVEQLLPRIVDVLNSYLRAVELADLKSASALVKLRAQMLRRIKVVVGEERVRDLLVMEFVLN